MKGFPNQVSDLTKLTTALSIAAEVQRSGRNVRDDSVYGTALVHGGVAGTGHTARPIAEYLAEQNRKRPSNRSHQTTARGLRELFEVLGLMVDDGTGIALTSEAGELARGDPKLTPDVLQKWRNIIRDMTHVGGYGSASHPYQVLLRLIARRPGITRAKCALALEARDDSEAELNRVAELSDMSEHEIIQRIGVTKTNWDNAKKILPSFAEQLGDVIKKDGQRMFLSDTPADPSVAAIETAQKPDPDRRAATIRRPRSARMVTASTIATAGTLDNEVDPPEVTAPTQQQLEARIRNLADRLRRHNEMMRKIAAKCEAAGATLYENPFDCLACYPGEDSLLLEGKTLDGTPEDERIRVREALSQLLYYEAFVTAPYSKGGKLTKIAVFEGPISAEHVKWLRDNDIETIWLQDNLIAYSGDSAESLAKFFGSSS